MTLWGVHLDFRKPEARSGWPVTIHYLPVVSLELFTSSSGSAHHHLPWWWLWTRHFTPNAWNFKCFLISCILNHRKYLQLCVSCWRTTDYTFLLGGCIIINQGPLKKAGEVGLWISRSISDLEVGSCIFKGHQVGNWVPDFGTRLAWVPEPTWVYFLHCSKMLSSPKSHTDLIQYFSSRSPKS